MALNNLSISLPLQLQASHITIDLILILFIYVINNAFCFFFKVTQINKHIFNPENLVHIHWDPKIVFVISTNQSIS